MSRSGKYLLGAGGTIEFRSPENVQTYTLESLRKAIWGHQNVSGFKLTSRQYHDLINVIYRIDPSQTEDIESLLNEYYFPVSPIPYETKVAEIIYEQGISRDVSGIISSLLEKEQYINGPIDFLVDLGNKFVAVTNEMLHLCETKTNRILVSRPIGGDQFYGEEDSSAVVACFPTLCGLIVFYTGKTFYDFHHANRQAEVFQVTVLLNTETLELIQTLDLFDEDVEREFVPNSPEHFLMDIRGRVYPCVSLRYVIEDMIVSAAEQAGITYQDLIKQSGDTLRQYEGYKYINVVNLQPDGTGIVTSNQLYEDYAQLEFPTYSVIAPRGTDGITNIILYRVLTSYQGSLLDTISEAIGYVFDNLKYPPEDPEYYIIWVSGDTYLFSGEEQLYVNLRSYEITPVDIRGMPVRINNQYFATYDYYSVRVVNEDDVVTPIFKVKQNESIISVESNGVGHLIVHIKDETSKYVIIDVNGVILKTISGESKIYPTSNGYVDKYLSRYIFIP